MLSLRLCLQAGLQTSLTFTLIRMISINFSTAYHAFQFSWATAETPLTWQHSVLTGSQSPGNDKADINGALPRNSTALAPEESKIQTAP